MEVYKTTLRGMRNDAAYTFTPAQIENNTVQK